jgi:hypothetical protein
MRRAAWFLAVALVSSALVAGCECCPHREVVEDGFEILVATGDEIDGLVLESLGKPSINGDGVVVFKADIEGGGHGIFTPDSVLVKTGDVVDGLTIDFIRFPLRINDAGSVAYVSDLSSTETALFTTTGGVMVKKGDVIGGRAISGIVTGYPGLNDAGVVAFLATSPSYRGVFTATSLVAHAEDTVGGVRLLGMPSSALDVDADGRVFFPAGILGEDGGAVFAPPDVVAKPGDVVGGITLTGAGGPHVGRDGVLRFRGHHEGGHGVFDAEGPIVKTGDVLGGKTLHDATLQGASAHGDLVIFGFYDGGRGFFTADGEVLVLVGDVVDGRTVKDMAASPQSIDDDRQVVFRLDFEDGTSAIVRKRLAAP